VQQVHLVGFTTDLDSLVFSTRKGAKSGSFVLPLDEHLLGLIAEAVRRRKLEGDDIEVPIEIRSPGSLVRRESTLSPREIQDRLRAGRSIAEVAREAGVDEEWVGRFSAPVEAERLQIVGRARQLVYAKPRRGDSGEAMGPSVRWNLADRGVRLTNDEFDGAWSAYQLADHTWMVTFTFVSRKREQSAEWEVDFGVGDVFARNRLASDLAYLEPGRRRRSAASLQPSQPPTKTPAGRSSSSSSSGAVDEPVRPTLPMHSGATKRAGAKRAGPKKAGTKRVAAKRVAAKRPAAKRPAAKKVAAKRPAAKKTAAKRPAAKKTATKRAAAKKATTSRGTARAAGRAPARASGAKRAATRTTASRRGAPPAPTPPTRAPEPIEPNELSRRRLQIVTGSPVANRGPRQLGTSRPSPGTRPRFATRPPGQRPPTGPATTGASSTGAATGAASTGPAGTGRSGTGASSTGPAGTGRSGTGPAGTGRSGTSPAGTGSATTGASSTGRSTRPGGAPPRDPRLDIAAEPDTSPEARRAERRRARAEARLANAGGTDSGGTGGGSGRPVSAAALAAGPSGGSGTGGSGSGEPAAATRVMRSERPATPAASEPDVPAGDGRVVTIRANRATPPTNEGEVILPANRPPLRPAQPAAQPKGKRRFGRSNGR
jgi:hypothetical protein